MMIFKTSPRGRAKSPGYRLVVSVTSTNLPVLQFFQRYYSGRIGGPYSRGSKWNSSYRWEQDDEDALAFLTAINPFVQIKQEQIQLAFEFRARIRSAHTESLGKGLGSRPMTDSEIAKRDAIYQRMRKLNRRGQPLDD